MVSEAKAFVETVRIQSFGCVRDARLELTRLHALIGPNDSGKSTVLAALQTACELIRVGEEKLSEMHRRDPRVAGGSTIEMCWNASGITLDRDSGYWHLQERDPDELGSVLSLQHPPSHSRFEPVRGALRIRWDPDAIRKPCELIPEGRRLTVSERGDGIPSVYEAILSRDRQAFDGIEAGLRQLFPTVRGIWLPTTRDSKKALGVTLTSGTKVHADEMSEGLLYWLAFAALAHVDRVALMLVEEPENGLHPSRIADVMGVLRAISSRTQVILATHSPLVINELQPDEVTILTRDPQSGTRATRLDRTKHFQQRKQVYALGELWLSFADGIEETALVSDEDTTTSTG